jgi:hypothetical protein
MENKHVTIDSNVVNAPYAILNRDLTEEIAIKIKQLTELGIVLWESGILEDLTKNDIDVVTHAREEIIKLVSHTKKLLYFNKKEN